jgi:large subunit ribosomal protein L22
MTPDESPETEAEEPKRRRRRSRGAASGDAPASEAPGSPELEAAAESDTDAPPETGDVIDETPEDVEAEEAAADVMLEADAEAEGEGEGEGEDEAVAEAEADEEALAELEPVDEPEAEAPAPSRRRLRRGAAAEPAEVPAPPPTPAPSRRRRRGQGERRDVVVRAQAKYVRSSARKARLVCDHIRGKSVEEARAILAHTSRAVARDWSKLLESAVANAENNHELVGEDLYIKAVHADEGPTIRRFRPRAMGRATRIRKRTSHLTILLTPKD